MRSHGGILPNPALHQINIVITKYGLHLGLEYFVHARNYENIMQVGFCKMK